MRPPLVIWAVKFDVMPDTRTSLIALFSSFLLLFSCSPSRQIQREIKKSPVFNRAFTGFTLLDPETGHILADVNGDHYFTPASTTKILTLYSCLKVLGDSVPGLEIQHREAKYEHGPVTLVRSTGDPTFLHPLFQIWQAPFQFLANQTDSIFLDFETAIERFGPGWAWDDYLYSFQPERSSFPIYGNVIKLLKTKDSIEINPPFFRNNFLKSEWYDSLWYRPLVPLERLEFKNQWSLDGKNLKEEQWLPFTEPDMAALLTDTLKKKVTQAEPFEFMHYREPWQTLYSTPLDTVMRRMMHQSDNLIAEQMLLQCARKKFGVFEQDTLIKWMLDSVLTDLPQRPKWIDGSGLSRYNLMTPQSIATVLLHLWREQPHDTLLSLFPAGGVDGTLSDWYGGKDGKPYVFAKTGSMSSVTCLSGYVRTRRGKTLIFSFMHNHFVGSSREWKAEMQRILERI